MTRQDVATLELMRALEATQLEGWVEIKVSPFVETAEPALSKAAVIGQREDGEIFQVFVYVNTSETKSFRIYCSHTAEAAVVRLLSYTHCQCRLLGTCEPANEQDLRVAPIVHPCAIHHVSPPDPEPPRGLVYRLNGLGREYFAGIRQLVGTGR
jgi:hypothetical protein